MNTLTELDSLETSEADAVDAPNIIIQAAEAPMQEIRRMMRQLAEKCEAHGFPFVVVIANDPDCKSYNAIARNCYGNMAVAALVLCEKQD